jgi:uncharacterized membrane protein YoaK (UPF0700 family)
MIHPQLMMTDLVRPQWSAFPIATETPRAVPILLAAVAGFVDACTFLGLFGFAQVTGSYVIAAAYPVTGSPGVAVLLAAPVFFAGGIAATLAAITGHAVARRALAAALALETLLSIGFAATFGHRYHAAAAVEQLTAAARLPGRNRGGRGCVREGQLSSADGAR